MELRPFVPRPYAGTRTLEGLRYRAATLDVTVHGFGDAPREVRLDSRVVPRAEVPAALTGEHTLEITLNGEIPAGGIEQVENVAAPATPGAWLEGGRLRWERVAGAARYEVVRNGEPLRVTEETAVPAAEPAGVAEYQVRAVDGRGLASFLSEPVRVGPDAATRIVEPPAAARQPRAGRSDPEHADPPVAGYARLTPDRNPALELPISVAAAGWYAIDARYANGSGPVSYGDQAAARSLQVDGRPAGTLLMPQRGMDRWDDWGYTNPVRVYLERGPHTVTVAYRPANRNMNGESDVALLDHLRITRLASARADTGGPGTFTPAAAPWPPELDVEDELD